MKTVKIIDSIHIAHTGVTYEKGQEVEVSDELAKKHVQTGYMKIIPDQPAGEAKPVAIKKK